MFKLPYQYIENKARLIALSQFLMDCEKLRSKRSGNYWHPQGLVRTSIKILGKIIGMTCEHIVYHAHMLSNLVTGRR
jgi:hypothetical protein